MQTVWITGKIIGLVSHFSQPAGEGCEHRGAGCLSATLAGQETRVLHMSTGLMWKMPCQENRVTCAAAAVQT